MKRLSAETAALRSGVAYVGISRNVESATESHAKCGLGGDCAQMSSRFPSADQALGKTTVPLGALYSICMPVPLAFTETIVVRFDVVIASRTLSRDQTGT